MSTNIRTRSLRGVLWNWKPVADLMPGRMGVMDIDGIVERHGQFLVMECKRPGEEVSRGQAITLHALGALPEFTVLILEGDRTTGEVHKWRRVWDNGWGPWYDGPDFPDAVRRWFKYAEEQRNESTRR